MDIHSTILYYFRASKTVFYIKPTWHFSYSPHPQTQGRYHLYSTSGLWFWHCDLRVQCAAPCLVCSVSELPLSPILMPEWVWKGARQVMWPESFSQHGNHAHVLPGNRNQCELSPVETQQPNPPIHSPVNIKLSLPYKGYKKALSTFQSKKKFQLLKNNKAHH